VLSGVTVKLYQGGTLIGTTTTDAAGNYSFGGLAAGAYTVREGQPSAYGDGFDYAAGVFIPGSDKTDAIGATLAAGATVGTAFTEKPGSLAGDVFVDPNHNGRLDAGEAGIAGVTLTLTDAEGDTRVATTDSNGHYAFPNLVNGTYAIAETQPAGYGDDADYAGTLGGAVGDDAISAVRITNGQNGTSYNFTETVPTAEAGPTGSISGHVYLDVNQDGRFDETQGDRYLDGVTVDLLRADASGNPLIAPDGTFDVITSTVTKDGGYYSFGGLAAGYYALYEHQPTAYLDGAEQIPGADGTFPSDANPVTPNGTEDPCLTDDAAVSKDVVFQVALPAGGQLVDYDFTEQGGSLAGAVAMPGERGLTAPQDADGDPVHAVIDLYYSADAGRTYTLLKTAQTGDDGTFTFAGLAAGTYKLVEHTPAGFVTGGEYGGVVTHAADNSMESEGTPADDPALPALTDIVLDAGDRGQGFGFLNKPSF
jgi:protocatechuate 3,4-dioxygenase beta subunit